MLITEIIFFYSNLSGIVQETYPQRNKQFVHDEVISSDARIFCANSTEKFWIQPDRQTMAEIDQQIELLDLTQEPDIEWKNGDVCLAFIAAHEMSFRGLITRVEDDGFEVFCVDYGYSFVMDRNQLQRIPSHLVAYPSQALECSLHGFQPGDVTVSGIPVGLHFSKIIALNKPTAKLLVTYVGTVNDCVTVRIADSEGCDFNQLLHDIVSRISSPDSTEMRGLFHPPPPQFIFSLTFFFFFMVRF